MMYTLRVRSVLRGATLDGRMPVLIVFRELVEPKTRG